jgi:hypothetical protein
VIKPVISSLLVLATVAVVTAGKPAPALAQAGCFADFNNAYGDFARNNPQNSSWGARDTYQYAYFMGEQGINILMRYQSCMDAADFATNFAALDGMRDKGKQGCESLNSGALACTPTYPRGY